MAAAITKYEGQISTWKRKNNHPCFRCLFPIKPKNSQITNCSSNGVIGSLGGFMGSLQATEIIKVIRSLRLESIVNIDIFDVYYQNNMAIQFDGLFKNKSFNINEKNIIK